MIGTRRILNLGIFMKYLGFRPKYKQEINLCLYIPYIHNVKVILYNNFSVPAFLLCPNDMKSCMEFSICSVMLALKKFQILEHFKFLTFRLRMLNLYYHVFHHFAFELFLYQT